MKFRRILSLLITVMMLLSVSLTATAETYNDVSTTDSYYEAVEALSSLGILKGYGDGGFQPDGKITRAEAAVIIMRISGMGASENLRIDTIFDDVNSSHWASGVISDAYSAGIINGMSLKYDANGNVIGGIFKPEDEVTYDQFIKMLVCALGYQKKAEASVAKGTDPYPTGYRMIATQKRITEGTSNTDGGAARSTIARLVYNALTVNLMDQTSFGSDENFQEINNQSILYTKLNAIMVDAKISNVSLDPSTKKVSLTIINGGYDQTALANYKYNTANCLSNVDKGDVNLAGMQGLTVTAIVDISEYGNEKLLAVFPKTGKNYELAITPSLFKDISGTNIRYYKDSEATTVNTSSKVEAPFNIYLNLVNVEEISSSSLIASTVAKYAVQNGIGGVSTNDVLYRFVDTDNNSYYDTLFIENAASFIVGKINSSDKSIYRSTNSGVFNSSLAWNSVGTYSLTPLSLDTSDEDVSYSIKDSNGNALDFEDISVGDVLTVYMSEESGYSHYEIVVSTARAVSGSIDETYTQKLKDSATTVTYYKIDGESYRLNNADSSSKLEPGLTGEFMLTADNKIIAFSLDAKIRNFAAAINVAKSISAFDSGVSVQLFTQNGNVSVYKLASTYYLNGVSSKVDDSTVTTVASTLKTAIAGQIVIYELNSSGEIKKLYYGNEGMKLVDEDYRLMDYTTPTTYKSYSSKLGSAYISDNTSIVAIKNSAKYTEDEQYSLISKYSLVDEKSYPCYVVTDSAREAEFVLLTGFVAAPSATSQPIIVTGIGTTAVNGYPRKLIKGYIGNQSVSYPLADESEVTFIDMSGKVDGNAFTTLGISTSYQSYTTLKAAKDAADSKVEQALAEQTAAAALLNTATAEHDAKKTALDEAKAALDAAKAALDEANASQQNTLTIEQTQLSLAEAQSAYDTAKEEKEASDAKLAVALTDKNNAEAAYISATKNCEETKAELAKAEENLTKAGEALIAAENAEKALNEKIAAAEAEKATLTQKLDALKKTAEASASNITKLTADVKSAKELTESKLKIKTSADTALKTAADEKQKADNTLLQAEKALKDLEAAKAEEAKITVAKAEVTKANTAVLTVSEALKKAQESQTKAESEYKTALASQTKAEEALTAEKKVLSDTNTAIAAAKTPETVTAEIETLKAQLTASKLTTSEANSNYMVVLENNTNLDLKYQELSKKLEVITADYNTIATTYEKISTENIEYISILDSKYKALDTANEHYSFILTAQGQLINIEALEAAVTAAQNDYDAKEAEYNTAKAAMDTAKTNADNADEAYNIALSEQTTAENNLSGAIVTENSVPLNVASEISVNDVLQITLNANDEITSYKHLVKNYGDYVYVMQATSNDEDSDSDIAAKLVAYPLYQSSLPDIIDDYDTFNGIVVKTGITMEGYGIGGRVYNVSGRNIEFFSPLATASTYAQAIENLKDASIDYDSYAYYVGATYSKPTVSTLDALKTYKVAEGERTEAGIKTALNNSDDIVYIYKYDGDTYLTYVIDTKSNNR